MRICLIGAVIMSLGVGEAWAQTAAPPAAAPAPAAPAAPARLVRCSGALAHAQCAQSYRSSSAPHAECQQHAVAIERRPASALAADKSRSGSRSARSRPGRPRDAPSGSGGARFRSAAGRRREYDRAREKAEKNRQRLQRRRVHESLGCQDSHDARPMASGVRTRPEPPQ